MADYKLDIYEIQSEEDVYLYKRYLNKIDSENPFFKPELLTLSSKLNYILFYFILLVDKEPMVLMPLVKRPININDEKTKYYDVISPYGYSGPLFKVKNAKEIICKFWDLVNEWYEDNFIVTEFIRFSLNANYLNYNGICINTLFNVKGEIIDSEKQWSNFKHKVRTNYRKAVDNNLDYKCHHRNISQKNIDDFYEIYISTMKRKNALSEYYYTKQFFSKYSINYPDNCAISIVYLNKKAISCEFLLLTNDTLYSFLGGTVSEYFHVRPNDFLKIMTINWARKLGYKYYILGGGRVDGDNLYKYKKSFFPKDDDVIFVTGRKIIHENIYSNLLNKTAKNKIKNDDGDYFPLYRNITNVEDDLNLFFKTIVGKDEWDAILNEFKEFEFYHTYDYHQLSKKNDETPVLITYVEKKTIIAIPLLIRKIPDSPYYDATSVYGYPGPLSVNIDGDDFNINNFSNAFNNYLKQLNLVSVFSRLNPFMDRQQIILGSLGEIVPVGKVVYIDLTKKLEEQRASFSKSTKSRINKARRQCFIKKVNSIEDLNIFIDIYYENMKRLNAEKEYFFNRDYFLNFYKSNNIKSDILIVYESGSNEPIAASMFVKSKDVVQFHLSGTKDKYLDIAPARLFIDEMRIIANNNGYKYFNLGGGLGGQEDSLFMFKSSFSKDFKVFSIWQHILNKEVYNDLCRQKKLDHSSINTTYFPLYRYTN